MPKILKDDVEGGRGRQGRREGKLAWLEAALFLFGAVCLGYVAWAQLDARWFQHRALARLESSQPDVDRAAREDILPAGAPLARLTIERLDVSVAVAEGTTQGVLRRAVGHLRRTALPGREGNVVLAGHRDTFFRPLEGIEVGDRISVDTLGGRDVYEVEWFQIIDPSELWVTRDSGYAALTLITCYPFHFIGSAPKRFVVRARRLEAAEAPAGMVATAAAGG